MTEITARTDIYNAIKNIAEVGCVYDYERWSDTWDGFLDLYKIEIDEQDVIRGWTISCENIEQIQLTYGNAGSIERTYTYKIRGYFGLNDEEQSEKKALAKVIEVLEALDADVDTDDSDIGGNYPAQLTVFEPRAFGDVLCHYAEITTQIIEFR